MLILARNIGQSIIINDDITITVVSVHGQQVKIGIDAPKHIDVHREEIYEKINQSVKKPVIPQPQSAGRGFPWRGHEK